MKIPTKETNILGTLITKAKKSHNLKQTNVLNVVFSLKMKRDSKYTAPQNTDDSKIIRPPLGSGLVNQTVDAILVEEDISALL